MVPTLQDTALGEFTNVGVNGIADVESKFFGLAGHETLAEGFWVEVSADEHKTTFSFFTFFPQTDFFAKVASKEHVNALEDKLRIHALHGEDALVSEQVFCLFSHEFSDPSVQLVHVQLACELVARRRDTVVVLVFRLRIQEFRVHLQGAFEVKRTDVDEMVWIDDAVLRLVNGSEGVDGFDSAFHFLEPVFVHEVDFVQHDSVGERQLFNGFVLHAFGFLLIEVLDDVLCVDHGHDAVEVVALGHALVHKESLSDRSRVSQTGGFNQHTVKILDSVVHVVQNFGQIATDGTADATVHDLNDAFFRTFDKDVLVDTDIAKFIFDHGEFHLVLGAGQNMIQQGGFPRTQKSREDGNRNAVFRCCCCFGHKST